MFFRQKTDPLLGRANIFVQSARVNAISMFTPLLNDYPFLATVDPEDWNFALTVAGVFMGLTRLNNLNIDQAREQKLLEKVFERFVEWDPKNAVRSFDDCKSFFEKHYDALTASGHESRFVASDAIGLWIVWNVIRREPETDNERKLVRVVGAMITDSFFNWWQE